MNTAYNGDWFVVEWISYTFSFKLFGCHGVISVKENVETIEIYVAINGTQIPIGTLENYSEEGKPVVVAFSAYNAAPGIRFKTKSVEITRQIPVGLEGKVFFHIFCTQEGVKVVNITDLDTDVE